MKDSPRLADEQTLLQAAPKVADAIQRVPGVVEVKDGIVFAGDALDINMDCVQASLEGMDPGAVNTLVEDALQGQVTTTIQRGPKLIGVRVWLPADLRQTEWDRRELLLRAPNGRVFPAVRSS
jgi:Cu/Ag efflux pump CusA